MIEEFRRLFQEGKITEEDYQILIEKLRKHDAELIHECLYYLD